MPDVDETKEIVSKISIRSLGAGNKLKTDALRSLPSRGIRECIQLTRPDWVAKIGHRVASGSKRVVFVHTRLGSSFLVPSWPVQFERFEALIIQNHAYTQCAAAAVAVAASATADEAQSHRCFVSCALCHPSMLPVCVQKAILFVQSQAFVQSLVSCASVCV